MRVRGFAHTLTALRPHLNQVVLIGGWAWYLYRKYRTGATGLPGEFTRDVDFAIPRTPASAAIRLDTLLDGAAFKARMQGEDRPPVTKHYWPSVEEAEAVVEFVTPARASGEVPTLEVGGVVAEQLRFVELLLDDPLVLRVEEHDEDWRFVGEVQVPRIGLFVLQKGLSFGRRRESLKRYKDLFYIFDLVDQTRGLLPEIHADLAAVVGRRGAGWLEEAANLLETACGREDADAIGRILEQLPAEDRPPRRYVAGTIATLVQMLRAPKG